MLEYGAVEDTAFSELARRGVNAVGMHAHTSGEARRSPRMGSFMQPYFGYSDELRVVLRDGDEVWGGVALFRAQGDAPFVEHEVGLLESLSHAMSVGTRAGLLATLAAAPPPGPVGPAVIIVGADDSVQQVSAGAEVRLRDLMLSDSAATPTGIVASLVGAARRFASGQTDRPPRCRVRSRSGMWLVLHATPLSPRGDTHGDVVVTIDEARPPEIVPLVVAAFDLTPREREITQLVLQGADTKEMAASLHLSAYTVQDHLKAIFTKADVGSRRELIARIYFDQYVPRMGTEIGPSGWFATTE